MKIKAHFQFQWLFEWEKNYLHFLYIFLFITHMSCNTHIKFHYVIIILKTSEKSSDRPWKCARMWWQLKHIFSQLLLKLIEILLSVLRFHLKTVIIFFSSWLFWRYDDDGRELSVHWSVNLHDDLSSSPQLFCNQPRFVIIFIRN